MRIKNLGIESFGKLEGVNIALDDKITVITGKNEAGKSSIATFIKYMLYGFDATKKSVISENQKKKYMPWDADECSGELTFVSADGNTYTAVRKTAARNQNTVFDENGLPKTAENAGDYFFDVGESAYKKTAFIGQNSTCFTDDGELDSALRNMVFSADESVDTQRALKKLEEMRKYYLGKTAKSGKIYELEKELCELTEQREKWKDGHKELLVAEHQLAEIQKKIAFNKEKKELLEKEKQNLECFAARQKLLQLEEAQKKLDATKTEISEHLKLMQNGSFVPDADFVSLVRAAVANINSQKENVEGYEAALENARDKLENSFADERERLVYDTLRSEGKTASALVSEISQAAKKIKKTKILAVVLTCLIVTLPAAIFFYVSLSKQKARLKELCKKYGCEDTSRLLVILSGEDSYRAAREAASRYFEELSRSLEKSRRLLEEYITALKTLSQKGGFDENQAQQYIDNASAWLEKSEALKSRCREEYALVSALLSTSDLEYLEEKSKGLDESIEIRDAKTVGQQLSFYTQANEALTVKERELERQAAVLSGTLPRPAEIQSRILSLTSLIDSMKEKHAGLCLAIETLERASENMRNEAAPKISAETSSLFSKITGGKYKALFPDSDMKLSFLENGAAEVRDAGFLSVGTLDAAYISLRIALCRFLYKENPTLVFDDAFANMDSERLENMLDFLVELSEDFQIVILSCHDREKNYLEGKAKLIDFAI